MNENYFHTTKKQGHTYQVNQNAVLASATTGEVCAGLLKLCLVPRLSFPININSHILNILNIRKTWCRSFAKKIPNYLQKKQRK